jgi:hypothetical protein
MEPAKVFEDILAQGKRLLWSGKMVTIPLGLGILCPILAPGGGFRQPGPVINHGQLVEFALLKEHQSLLLPGMGRAWRTRSWRVENPRLVAGLAGRAIVSSQTDPLLTRAVQ